ncbi:MAG: response regulator [Candidatus Liptonbacteria bacterium]|nr:response regulator [Candidatus Liptonbacteria bacterium]
MAEIPRPIRILIVDDDKKLNRALEFQLNKAGFLTKSAFDGASALNILRNERFDLIVLDLVMPGIPGFDVLLDIRRGSDMTPVIVLSMLRQEEDVRRAKELGANEYFSKQSPYMDQVVKYAEKLSIG